MSSTASGPTMGGRRGPLDPRLLQRGRATLAYLVAGVAVGSATAALTIVQAWALSRALGDIFATNTLGVLPQVIWVLIAVFTGKAVLAWLNQWLAQRTAAAVKSRLRRDVLAARLANPVDPNASTASLVTLLTQGLDALDGYYSKYLPQLVLAVTVPLIIGIAILTADLTSAIIVAATLPLIPIFMALVGWTTEARTRRRWLVQTRLAGHFADLVAGLPTLQVFGRARAQAQGLQRSETAHRKETMATLRVSFLSALVLELLASLSVAIVAVAIGFRVVFYEVDLSTAFFVLILAPEAYLPVRQVGIHYHDAADGMAAAESAFAIIESTPGSSAAATGAAPVADAPLLELDALSHTYPETDSPALGPTGFVVHQGELAVITGASGAGKTTLLHAVMGFLQPTAGRILIDGVELDPVARRSRIAWVAQNPGMITGSIADNVRLGDPDASRADVALALKRAGGASLDPDRSVGDEGEGLSAGERRRVAVARAFLRITSGRAELLVLDEPTAGLDAATETAVLDAVIGLDVTTLAVSHRLGVIARADRLLDLRPPGPAT